MKIANGTSPLHGAEAVSTLHSYQVHRVRKYPQWLRNLVAIPNSHSLYFSFLQRNTQTVHTDPAIKQQHKCSEQRKCRSAHASEGWTAAMLPYTCWCHAGSSLVCLGWLHISSRLGRDVCRQMPCLHLLAHYFGQLQSHWVRRKWPLQTPGGTTPSRKPKGQKHTVKMEAAGALTQPARRHRNSTPGITPRQRTAVGYAAGRVEMKTGPRA